MSSEGKSGKSVQKEWHDEYLIYMQVFVHVCEFLAF